MIAFLKKKDNFECTELIMPRKLITIELMNNKNCNKYRFIQTEYHCMLGGHKCLHDKGGGGGGS